MRIDIILTVMDILRTFFRKFYINIAYFAIFCHLVDTFYN